MKIKIYISVIVGGLLLLASLDSATAQTWQWAIGATGSGFDDEAHGVSSDAAGNFYVTGRMQNEVDFAGTVLNEGAFLAKYNNAGALQWAKESNGPTYEFGESVVTADDGTSYVTGGFRDTIQFGTEMATGNGGLDVYLAAFDNAGTCSWIVGFGGSDWDGGNTITRDASGNLYVAGYFRDTMMVGATQLISLGQRDVFVAKLDNAGTPVWATSGGGTSNEEIRGIAVDASGNVFVCGYFSATATFGATPLTADGVTNDAFVAKLTSAGAFTWAVQCTGPAGQYEMANDISVDGSGNPYVTGFFKDTITFGGSSVYGSGPSDAYVLKLDPAGATTWLRAYGGTTETEGLDIAFDGAGNWFLSGYFKDTIAVGATNLYSAGSGDVLIAKFDNTDALVWATQGGAANSDRVREMAINSLGNICVAGQFDVSAQFGSTPVLTGNVAHDVLVAVIDGGAAASGMNENYLAKHVNIYPNPFSSETKFYFNLQEDWQLNILDLTGRIILTETGISKNEYVYNRGNISAGTYIYSISTTDYQVGGKLIITD